MGIEGTNSSRYFFMFVLFLFVSALTSKDMDAG